ETAMKIKFYILLIGSLFLSGCNLSVSTVPTPAQFVEPTLAFISTETPVSLPVVATDTPALVVPSPTNNPASVHLPTNIPNVAPTPTANLPGDTHPDVCADPQVTSLITSLKRAIINKDGSVLSSVVSPNGMEVRYFRNGNPITYSPYQTQFLFET